MFRNITNCYGYICVINIKHLMRHMQHVDIYGNVIMRSLFVPIFLFSVNCIDFFSVADVNNISNMTT